MTARRRQPKTQPVLAVLLAWLIPGLGHIYLGRRVRGLVLLGVVGLTFWAGVAIGGVMTVDYYYERWWFTAQMFTGIHGLVGWYRQRGVYQELQKHPPLRELVPAGGQRVFWQQYWVDRELAARGLALVAPADNVARAYSGVAGLLNLMCIFDALVLSLMGVYGEPARRDGTDAPPSPVGETGEQTP